MRIVEAEVLDGAYSLRAAAVFAGSDLNITICGGTRHHIGAAAVGVPRPSLRDPEAVSASTSVFCVVGHKDDALAKEAADRLAARCNCTVCVSVGIHVDDPGQEGIARLTQNFTRLLERLEQRFQAEE